MHTLKIMIAEDELLTRLGIQQLLEKCSLHPEIIQCAENGQETMELLRTNPVDVVLLDLNMPLMDGLQVLECIRKESLQVTPVVLTFHEEFEQVRSAMRLGAFDYILKSEINQERLDDVLMRVYETRKRSGTLTEDSKESTQRASFLQLLKTGDCTIPWPAFGLELTLYLLQDAERVQARYDGQEMQNAMQSLLSLWEQEMKDAGTLLYLTDRTLVLFSTPGKEKTATTRFLQLAQNYLDMNFDAVHLGLQMSAAQAYDQYTHAIQERNDSERHPVVERIKAYIRAHYQEDVTVSVLAKQFYLSEGHISHLFNQYAGMSIPDYLNRKRVEAACMLLQDSGMKVYEIAQAVGFHSSAYFCTIFKKIMGYAPSQGKEDEER